MVRQSEATFGQGAACGLRLAVSALTADDPIDLSMLTNSSRFAKSRPIASIFWHSIRVTRMRLPASSKAEAIMFARVGHWHGVGQRGLSRLCRLAGPMRRALA